MAGIPDRLRIATRKSALALWQSEHVAERLRAAHPGLAVELVPMSTQGDQVLDRPLAAIGGKGLFLKELEIAMLEGRADCAVHSLKDVPMLLDAPFAIAAVLERADPFDGFVSNRFEALAALPRGARVGTSSLRRQAQLRALRPDLALADLRGNVNTRLARLDAGEYQAIVLACAGLQRLGLGARVRARLAMPEWVPAVAQGAIGIECRADAAPVRTLVAVLDHDETRLRTDAERAMNRHLHGSCHVPVAGYAQRADDVSQPHSPPPDGGLRPAGAAAGDLHLTGLVGDAASGRLLRSAARGDARDPEGLGLRVAEALLAQGAREMLA